VRRDAVLDSRQTDVLHAGRAASLRRHVVRQRKVVHEGQMYRGSESRTHCRYTVRNIRISADSLRRVFRILTEPVSYTFVSVNRRNSEAPAHTEVRIILKRYQKRTEPGARQRATYREKFGEVEACGSRDMRANRQTGRHTHRHVST